MAVASSPRNPLANAPSPRRRPMFSLRSVSSSLLTWVLALAVFGPFLIYPVFQVLRGAITKVDLITGARELNLSLLLLPIQNSTLTHSVVNSFWLGILSTLLSAMLALPLAYASARLKFAGKGLLTGLLLVPLLLPPLVGAIGLKQMLAREGFINTLRFNFNDWLFHSAWVSHSIEILNNRLALYGLGQIVIANPDANRTPIDFLSDSFLGGWGPIILVVLVTALHLYPLIYLNVSAAWANVDSSLEEAAENQGASAWRVFFTVTLPLLFPAFMSGALIVFIFAFTDLGTPLIFGFKEVAAVKIFDAKAGDDPAGYVLAFYLVILAGAIFWISRRFLDGGRIATLARGTRRARESAPGPVLGTLNYLYFFLVIGLALLPHVGVVMASFASDWTGTLFPTWTSDNYLELFNNPTSQAAASIKLSLFCASFSMLLDVFGGAALAYALVRGRVWARGLLDTLAMLPLALPGLILAFGLLTSYRNTPLDPILYSPVPLLIISYAIRRLPYALRSVSAGLQQMSVTLEEASLNMGASPWRTVWLVTRPLVTANLIAAGLLTFAFAVLEVSDSLILASGDQTPIAQAIYALNLNGELYRACALGVVGMLILSATFLLVNKLLGKQLGALFRA